jgi:hypothetical protein
VRQLDSFTVEYESGFGCGNWVQNLVRITLRVPLTQYGTAVEWLNDLIFRSEFTRER